MTWIEGISKEDIMDRVNNFDFEINDGLDLSILLETYHNFTNSYSVGKDYIDIYDINCDEYLSYFSEDGNFIRIKVPSGNNLHVTFFDCDNEFDSDNRVEVQEILSEMLPGIIDSDFYVWEHEVFAYKRRVEEIAKRCLPLIIGRREDGEFTVEDSGCIDEDCSLHIKMERDGVAPYYYSDNDYEYHFVVDINSSMTDEEIMGGLVAGFSKKFGWVDIFLPEYSGDAEKVFWGVLYLDEGDNCGRHLFGVSRSIFDLSNSTNAMLLDEEYDEEDYEEGEDPFSIEYDKLCEEVLDEVEKKLPELLPNGKDRYHVEFLEETRDDWSDCCVISVRLLSLD